MENIPFKPPFMMTEEAFNAILNALMSRRVTMPCSRCGHVHFELQPSYTMLPLVPDYNMPSSYGPYIPCAIVACRNCGNVSLHSLAQLGLLEHVQEPEPAQGRSPAA